MTGSLHRMSAIVVDEINNVITSVNIEFILVQVIS